MGKDTSIEWCDHSWNAWRGCAKVSPGCANCYAEAMSKRNPSIFGHWGDKGTRVVAAESGWRQPRGWDAEARNNGVREKVFVNSMSDFFEDWQGPILDSKGQTLGTWGGAWPWTPHADKAEPGNGWRPLTMDDVRVRVWDLMLYATNLDFLIVTKRPENIMPMLRWMHDLRVQSGLRDECLNDWITGERPPSNIWLGVTAENQEQADKRIPILLQTPVKVRFLSVEPQIEHIVITEYLGKGIHWVIQGGESGPKARPFHTTWAKSLRDQCEITSTAYFLKQLGSKPQDPVRGPEFGTPPGFVSPTHFWAMKLRDSHGGDPSEWPEDLRVREFPKGVAS